MTAVILLNDITIKTYHLTGFQTLKGDENVMEKQLWQVLQHGGWIVARNWVHPYKGNSA